MVLVARYGEIFLKGGNRLDFERKLVSNIMKMFEVKVIRKRNRLLVSDNVDLRWVFGLVSYSPSVEVELDIEEIKVVALDLLQSLKFSSFAVSAKRMSVNFEMGSQKINETVGDYIVKNLKKKVDLSNPDVVLGIEFIDGKAYVFVKTIDCFGGLPVGVEGKVVLLVEDDKSILAGLLVMKRGCDVIPVSFKEVNISLLQKYSPAKLNLKIIKSIDEVKKFGEVLVLGKPLAKPSGLVELDPLVGLDDIEISKKISIFKLK